MNRLVEALDRHNVAVQGLAALLTDRGWLVEATHVEYPLGEMDVVARYKGSEPVYFEVKGRHSQGAYRHARGQIRRAVAAGVAHRGVYWAYCEARGCYLARLVSRSRELE